MKGAGNDKSSNAEATAFLEGYLTCAKEMEIPLRAVCERLGQILSEKRQRTREQVSVVWANAKGDTPKRSSVEPLESDGNTHRRAQTPAKKQRKKLSPAALKTMRAAAANARKVLAVKRAAAKKQSRSKVDWWYKLSEAEKKKIIRKRVAATAARKTINQAEKIGAENASTN